MDVFYIWSIEPWKQKFVLYGRWENGESASIGIEYHSNYLYIKPLEQGGSFDDRHIFEQGVKHVLGDRIKELNWVRRKECADATADQTPKWLLKIDVFRRKQMQEVDCIIRNGGVTGVSRIPYESTTNSVLRFIQDTDILPCSWIEIDKNDLHQVKSSPTDGYMPYHEMRHQAISNKKVDRMTTGAWKMLIFDIEAAQMDGTTRFVKADEKQCPVCSISIYIHSNEQRWILLVLHTHIIPPDIPQEWEVLMFDKEMDLLKMFLYIVRLEDPDFISGWNITKFDLPYLIDRWSTLNVDDDVFCLGRTPEPTRYWVMQNGGVTVNCQGRVILDGYLIAMKYLSQDGYSLTLTAQTHLDNGQDKEVFSHSLPPYHQEDSPVPLSHYSWVSFLSYWHLDDDTTTDTAD